MRCYGINKNKKRCRNKTPFLFCEKHNKQWVFILLISIPTILGLYAGIFQDLIKPILTDNNQELTNEFLSAQLSSVKELSNELQKELIEITFICEKSDDIKVNQIAKCYSYYQLSSQLKFSEISDGINDIILRPDCETGKIINVIDSVDTGKESLESIINIKLNNENNVGSSGETEISSDNDLLFYDKLHLNFLYKYLDDFYLPKKIKLSINELKKLNYSPIVLKEIVYDNKMGVIFDFVYHRRKGTYKTWRENENSNLTSLMKVITKNQLVYKVNKDNQNLKYSEFIQLIVDLNSSILNWKKEIDL